MTNLNDRDERDYNIKVVALARASAAFDGEEFDCMSALSRKRYLDRAEFSWIALAWAEDVDDLVQLADRIREQAMLTGRLS